EGRRAVAAGSGQARRGEAEGHVRAGAVGVLTGLAAQAAHTPTSAACARSWRHSECDERGLFRGSCCTARDCGLDDQTPACRRSSIPGCLPPSTWVRAPRAHRTAASPADRADPANEYFRVRGAAVSPDRPTTARSVI